VRRLLVLLGIFVASLIFVWLAPGALENASEELVTFASIVAAGAIAAMALCTTIVAPERVNRAYAETVKKFLSQQSGYWTALFLFAVLTSVLVVLGEIFGWLAILDVRFGRIAFEIPAGAMISFGASLAFLLTVLLLIDFAKAMRDLMLLGTKVTGATIEADQAERIRRLGSGTP
jgi:hypothetical protein